MIVDLHTHIFPPDVLDNRDRYLREDPTFRLLYSNPRAKLATAEDLLRSMDLAGIDLSVALGFAWSSPDHATRHDHYLLDAAARHPDRIVPFLAAPPPRANLDLPSKLEGARGLGELRPENTGLDVAGTDGDLLAGLAERTRLPLLFHVSEPVGHAYTGKGGLDLGAFYRFVAGHPAVTVIGAHWAGGLPFYASMPEVRALFHANLYVDTAATSLLYDDGVYERVAGLIGPERILFGSDFPLLSQKRSRQRIEESRLDRASKALILGDNAAHLLGLP